jgi:hypothetical protein
MARRTIPVSFVVIAGALTLAGCSTAGSVTHTKPIAACSLMTKSEASAIFPTGGTHQFPTAAPVRDQSYCSYSGKGLMLITNVSWSKKEIATFAQLHRRSTHLVPGMSHTGAVIPVPHYSKLTVDGTSAYWLAQTPAPISGSGIYPSQMSARKHGYLVFLTATDLTESQIEKSMATILRSLG